MLNFIKRIGRNGKPIKGQWISAQSMEGLSVGLLNAETGGIATIAVPVAGHSIIQHPTQLNLGVMFAHSPGTRSCVIDLQQRHAPRFFDARDGEYFYGHGAFSADGDYLFSTEYRLDTHEGAIVVRDFSTLQVIGEFPSHGIGPHELLVVDGGQTIVVANGGRIESKSDDIESSLCTVDLRSGKLLDQQFLSDKAMSFRHLCLTSEGRIAAGLGYFGTKPAARCCLAVGPRGGALRLVEGPAGLHGKRVLSMVYHEATDSLGMTHPEGHAVSFWTAAGVCRGVENIEFPQGIALSPEGNWFIVTTDGGTIEAFSSTDYRRAAFWSPTMKGLNSKHLTAWR